MAAGTCLALAETEKLEKKTNAAQQPMWMFKDSSARLIARKGNHSP